MVQNHVSQLVEPCIRRQIHIGTWKEVKLKLTLNYTDEYPDALPELVLETVDGDLSETESAALLKGLLDVVSHSIRSKNQSVEYLTGRREQGLGNDIHIGFAS